MSDFSILYKKYNSISNLTNNLNNSIFVLKRQDLVANKEIKNEYPQLKVTIDEVNKANEIILETLSILKDFYEKQDSNNELYYLMENTLFRNQILDNNEYKDQIMVTLGKVENNSNLNDKDLFNIDKFVSILDNEAAILYRRLRTKRE